MLNLGRTTTPTFSLAGHDWPLTEVVKAYLEWFAIDVNDLRDGRMHNALYWEDEVLYLAHPETEEDNPRVFTPESALDTMFEEVSDECIWGWIIGCDLTKWHPKDIDPDIETVAATRQRITERVVWSLTADREVSDEPRTIAREVLGQYSSEEWDEWTSEDPALSIAKEELEL